MALDASPIRASRKRAITMPIKELESRRQYCCHAGQRVGRRRAGHRPRKVLDISCFLMPSGARSATIADARRQADATRRQYRADILLCHIFDLFLGDAAK